MAKTCQICGANSGMYPLCTTHLKLKNEGKVEKCPECGKWHLTAQACSCKKPKFDTLPTEGFDKCVLCGEKTKGYAFCKNCWKERGKKELLEILNFFIPLILPFDFNENKKVLLFVDTNVQ